MIDLQPFLSVMLAIGAFANRVAEVVKARLTNAYPDMRPGVISEIALMTSIVAGVFAAVFLNVNLFLLFPTNPYFAQVPPLAGVIFTGFMASVFSEGIQWFFDLINSMRTFLGNSGTQPPPGGATIQKTETVQVGADQPETVKTLVTETATTEIRPG